MQAVRPELVDLAAWPPAALAKVSGLVSQPLRSRVKHVVMETARTRLGAELLGKGRLRQLGRLLFASHDSCRRDYDCSAPELDLVLRAARRAGAWGARMTGAGWGGNVLVLLGPANGAQRREELMRGRIGSAFVKRFGREPAITLLRASGGSRREPVT